MPDGSEKLDLVPIGALAKSSPKTLAVKLAREGLHALEPAPIAQLPSHLRGMNAARLDELKKSSQDHDKELVSAWTEWQYAYSGCIVENGNRLRGALWMYRELCKHNDDLDCLDLADKVLEILNRKWGVYDVPSSRQDCDRLALETAQSMAKVETRRWEDRA